MAFVYLLSKCHLQIDCDSSFPSASAMELAFSSLPAWTFSPQSLSLPCSRCYDVHSSSFVVQFVAEQWSIIRPMNLGTYIRLRNALCTLLEQWCLLCTRIVGAGSTSMLFVLSYLESIVHQRPIQEISGRWSWGLRVIISSFTSHELSELVSLESVPK